ncbi:uncharacterized protein DUF3787 [Keratinibaculum paraultunense]|uniref:Uncharacterized protein DUF3787 n=1 Tax=Keratinibaculum paraultunense TaxID=1278232 RepID=A0A4R3KY99_9FIRM|nr:DUF3787 domain-containing protein [Keratinibaculum paraultunense]QQY78876.1 DUF3787 domain-containing protein [Keratinibaculum paraultunense]TCS90488.1 uncharacterized protein DUF3787 [Keratinibaculum paraultunense]
MDNKNCKQKPIIKTNIGYQMYREPKNLNTTTDAFYNVEKRKPNTNVAIPTLDAIIEAKEWVDDINRK